MGVAHPRPIGEAQGGVAPGSAGHYPCAAPASDGRPTARPTMVGLRNVKMPFYYYI